MTVTYIFHSCFAIQTEEANIVFDCYSDPRNLIESIVGNGKRTYFVASHRHPDHFNDNIFTFRHFDAIYILSDDIIKMLRKNKNIQVPQQTHFLHPGESYKDEILKIGAFPSTDVGISACVETVGKTIFHAGDLNLWHWKDESTSREIKMAYGNYNAALKKISDAGYSAFDIAMFPVDSRLGTDYAEGARMFLNKFKVSHFFPMHFWDCPEKAIDFALYKNPEFGQCHALTTPGDCVSL